MRRWVRVFVAVTLLVLPGACDRPSEEPARATPELTTLWGQLGAWAGSGDRQTESFDVTSGALRLRWEAHTEATPEAGRLRVSLHSAISGRLLQTVVEVRGTGADTVRFAAGPRVAYLLIESDGVEWQVGLDEGVMSSSDAGLSDDSE